MTVSAIVIDNVDSQENVDLSFCQSQSTAVTTSSCSPRKKLKLCTMDNFVDYVFTPGEQSSCMRKEALAMILNGWSYNSLQQPWSISFFQIFALRLPSRYLLEKQVSSLFNETKVKVRTRLGSAGFLGNGWLGRSTSLSQFGIHA